jgi:hypothetical protein
MRNEDSAERRIQMTDEAKFVFIEEDGEPVLHVELNGKRIAKRYPGESWISLEPGYTVRGSEPGANYNIIEIEYEPTGAERQ